MLGELFPLAVYVTAQLTDEFTAVSTKTSGSSRRLGTLFTLDISRYFRPLERLLNLEQAVDMEGWREASYAIFLRKEGGLSAGRAAKRESLPRLFRGSDHQSLEAVFTVDMEAVKKLGFLVGVETDGAGELVFQLFESYRSLRFSHLISEYTQLGMGWSSGGRGGLVSFQEAWQCCIAHICACSSSQHREC